MKTQLKWWLLGLCLTTLAVVATPIATAQTPVSLKVYDPTGAIEVTQLHAPRLSDLNGKTICLVSDEMWEAQRTFALIADLLQKQFPTAKIIAQDKFSMGTTGQRNVENPLVAEKVKAAGCEAAIVGNAG